MSSIPAARGVNGEGSAPVAARRSASKDERRFDFTMFLAVLGGESTPNAIGTKGDDAGRTARGRGAAAWRPSDSLQSSVEGAPKESRSNGREAAADRNVGTSGGAGNVAEEVSSVGPRPARAADGPPVERAEAAQATARPPAASTVAGGATGAGAEKAAGPASGIALTTAAPGTGAISAAKMENIVGMGPAGVARVKGAEAATPAAPAAPARPVFTPPRPAGVFVMPFPDGAGAEGKVRLVVRGSSLSATFLSSDRETLKRLGEGIADLQKALADRGFDDAQFTMRWVRPPETGEPPTHAREGAYRQSARDSGGQAPERGQDRSARRDRHEHPFTFQSEV